MLHVKRPTQLQTLPDVSAAEKKREVKSMSLPVRGYVCCNYPSRPSQNGRKTHHGSLGRGTLIICDCPGSMMGNKLSVISHQRTQRHKTTNALALHQSPHAPHIPAAEASVT